MDFKIPKTKVEIEKIKKFESEENFMSLSVELFKEVATFTSILSCSYRLDNKNNPREWKRNEAILGGLMIRLTKLQVGFIDQICQKRMEIANIIFRCMGENIINLIYLLKKKADNLFNEFVEYSLREEKRLLKRINRNILDRNYEIPIETRMKHSINRAFRISNFNLEQIEEKKWKPWGEKIYERAKKIGLDDIYFALFSLPSHAVHGNWQDLITHHLNHENGEFSPKTEWSYPRPQPILSIALLSSEVNKLYLEEIIQDCLDKEQILKMLKDVFLRIRVVDEVHEEFIQKHSSEL